MKAFDNGSSEMMIWLQTQTPSGNWTDSLGVPYTGHHNGSFAEAVKRAEDHAAFLTSRGDTCRIVHKVIEVLVEV